MVRITLLAVIMAAYPLAAVPVKKSSQQHARTRAAEVNHVAGARARTVRRARVRKPPAPSYQLHPDPERYTQIQQALIDRGYFKGQPNGTWGDDSEDALKRFQADQKLDNDGKLDAHTLTALGLGPKHDGTSAGVVPLAAASGDGPQ